MEESTPTTTPATATATASTEISAAGPKGSDSGEEYQSSEDVLKKLGWKNAKLCYTIVSLSFIWALIALPAMCSDFAIHGIPCLSNMNITDCDELNGKFNSINAEFNMKSNSLYSGDLFITVFFLGNMLVGSFLS
uniref:Uncharacterized protein n=1 Tax=Panagrolaimus sp. ES5 TaxID=591445 RepID=A0AC34G9K2_9BILA